MELDKPIIELKNIKKNFFLPHEKHDTFIEYFSHPERLFRRAGEQYEVLKDVDAKIYPGEFVGIMGRNGSGKSTLLKFWLEFILPQVGR